MGIFIRTTSINRVSKLDEVFDYEDSTMACFNRVLYSFLKTGESAETLTLLAKANAKNKFVIAVITTKKLKGHGKSSYILGSKDEALYYASFVFYIWQELKGAVAFLAKHKK